MKRARLRWAALGLIAIVLAQGVAQGQEESPNVLILVSDDVSWKDLGAMGNEALQTPNLDALAEGGMLCTHAFLTIPQCSPSRISVLTGKYPHATGAEDLHMPLPAGERLLPSYLSEAGYFTGHMKKTHYGENGNAQFDWYSGDLEDFPAFLDEAEDKPFFMWVGFRDAHRGYEKGAFDPPHDPDEVNVPPYLVDDAATREDLALYYDEVARMDKHAGEMIDELRSRELFDSTIIVYFGDNGMPFPRAKGTLYDSGIGTPFIVSWPGAVPPGTTHEGMVSVVDLAPTILEAAGLNPKTVAPGMQGRSMLARWQNPDLPGRDYVFSERNWHNCDEHMRSVRTKRYKLIRNAYLDLPHGTASDLGQSPSFKSLLNGKQAGTLTPAQAMIFTVPRPRFELYDLEADPWETRNLAETDEGREIVERLADVLDAWGDRTGDFPPWYRRRGDNTDRMTGVKFLQDIPPMQDLRPGDVKPLERSDER